MKTKNQKELLTKLAKWLQLPGNSATLLASKLGFKTSFTVIQWIYRERIPKKHREAVKAIMKEVR